MVLLTHDQHADNLDDAGRSLLSSAGRVITTRAGAARLGAATGLAPWSSLSGPITGQVIGFALRWTGQEHGALWISGDTVLYDGVREVATRLRVGTVLLHLGAVRFPITGPLRYTMGGRDGVRLCELIGARTVLPVHYEGWSHFRQGRRGIEEAFAAAPADGRDSLRWLTPGEPVQVRT